MQHKAFLCLGVFAGFILAHLLGRGGHQSRIDVRTHADQRTPARVPSKRSPVHYRPAKVQARNSACEPQCKNPCEELNGSIAECGTCPARYLCHSGTAGFGSPPRRSSVSLDPQKQQRAHSPFDLDSTLDLRAAVEATALVLSGERSPVRHTVPVSWSVC